MVSTTPSTILAPPPGGMLLYLRLESYSQTLLISRTLSQLIILPSCGVQSWDANDRVLFIAWAEAGQETVLRGLLSAFGEVLSWSSRLVLSGHWTVFGGSPIYAEHEYELLAQEAAA